LAQSAPSRRRRLVVGALALSLAGSVGLAGLAAGAATVEEPATVSRQAYFTHPVTQVTPPLLTTGFPPGTMCLVAGLVGAAQLCGEEVQQVGGALGLSDGLPIPQSPDGDVAQPVAPGTTPVGMLGGQPRYTSLFQLTLPTLPEGQGFASFELVLHADGLAFAAESPALRAVVLSLLSQVSDQDPARFAEELGQVLQSGELVTDAITGIEACPSTQPWKGGDAQASADDGTRLPDVDCLLGTTGTFDEAAGTWTFDLTFAVQAWTEGAPGSDAPLPNEGIVLRPVGAPNLAYGDPDVSTNWVVSLADSEAADEGLRPRIRYSLQPLADDGGPLPFDPGPAVEVPVDVPAFVPSPAPAVPAVRTPSPGAALAGSLRARYAEAPASGGPGHLPGWTWLALPLGLGGATLFGQALAAPADAARRRPGALTRLVAADAHRVTPPTAPPRS